MARAWETVPAAGPGRSPGHLVLFDCTRCATRSRLCRCARATRGVAIDVGQALSVDRAPYLSCQRPQPSLSASRPLERRPRRARDRDRDAVLRDEVIVTHRHAGAM